MYLWMLLLSMGSKCHPIITLIHTMCACAKFRGLLGAVCYIPQQPTLETVGYALHTLY
jgi:hypothetical protein